MPIDQVFLRAGARVELRGLGSFGCQPTAALRSAGSFRNDAPAFARPPLLGLLAVKTNSPNSALPPSLFFGCSPPIPIREKLAELPELRFAPLD